MLSNQEKSIGPRGNVMTKMHWSVFWCFSLIIAVLVAASSLVQVEMHHSTPGENYQCTNFALEHEDGV